MRPHVPVLITRAKVQTSSALQNRPPVWSSNAHGRHIESHAGPQQKVKNDLKYFEKMTNSYNNFKFPKILHKEFLSAE